MADEASEVTPGDPEASDAAGETGSTGRATDPAPGGLPAAVLWDMDGTLLDTEPYWMEQEHALVESFGGRWSEADAKELVGNPLLVSADYIRARTPVDLDPQAIVNTLQDGVIARLRERVPWRPGARELLAALRDTGVPCALVTMSWREMVDIIVDSLPPGTFATIVTGDEVTHGKPHPEPYLTAARTLGVPVQECVAIEDSLTGAESALAAGARTIVVPHVVSVPPRPQLTVLSTLDGVRPVDLLPLTLG